MSCNNESVQNEPLVCIIDDEIEIRESLVDLFESADMRAEAYANAGDFLAQRPAQEPSCIFLDVQLPDINGLDLQMRLELSGDRTPIVFMTGYGDVPTSVQAMKAGAADFILKPLCPAVIIDAANAALRKGLGQREQHLRRKHVLECAGTLTPREREVMGHVALGSLNKQIAWELQISEIMVKIHRGRIMKKMEASSLADLIRKTEVLYN